MDEKNLSQLAHYLIKALEEAEEKEEKGKITVNPLISKVATWYEKLRNAMDYREEEVILRAAIERIIKRRILLGGTGKKIAEPLIRELIWARYFQETSVSESIIEQVGERIDLYLSLRQEILTIHNLKETEVSEWMYHLLSSEIERLVNPNKEKELISNFMFQIIKNSVTITDDSEETKDAQVFIAVRKSFAKDDIAFLRYHLFFQYFGSLTKESVHEVASSFAKGYKEINQQLSYSRKDRMYSFVRSKTAIFYILSDILAMHKGKVREALSDPAKLEQSVFEACRSRYSGISSKVRRAMIRSVIFVFLTKAFFAFAIEGTYETLLYKKVLWSSIVLNTTIPPLLMIVVGLFIRVPGQSNSERILKYIRSILFEDTPNLGPTLSMYKNPPKRNPLLTNTFTLLWFLAFVVTFGAIVYILSKLQFNIISQGIFLFFVTIVSFLSYRIGNMSKEYTVDERQGVFSPIVDFAFMPVVRVGRHLTEGISQINVLLFIFDFLIETPFKGLFAFFEQWFFFLHAKREELE